MNKLIKKILILGGIFLIAAIAFLWMTRGSKEEQTIDYGVMEEASLPIVSMSAEGYAINTLYGYVNEMGASYVQESLTPLAADRRLPVTIETCGNEIRKIRYEIRSLDGEELVEAIDITDWETSDGKVQAVLPIQDIIRKEMEYSLRLTLETDLHNAVYYYTRIIEDETLHTKEMLEYVSDFHASAFHAADAQEYAINWEVDASADKDTLASVNIHSDFSQLTYGDLSPIAVGDPQITVLEMDDTFGSFQVRYELQADGDDTRSGNYVAEEFFCLQWSSLRFYLMDYERTMRQEFEASVSTFTEDSIEFGMVQESDVSTVQSPDGSYRVFTVGGDLWSYSEEKREAVLLFSFRQDGQSSAQRLHEEYEVQLVSVDDNGNVEFFVYGYMNRGDHEGQVGLSYYRYVKSDNALQEIFYVSSDKSYEVLREDIRRLSHREGDLVYILFDNNVYAVDYQGKEVVVVVENADARGLVVSEDQNAIAWQQGDDLRQAGSIQILYLDSGKSQILNAASGEYLRTQGFIGQDSVSTAGRTSDIQAEGFETIWPQYRLTIVNPEGGEEAHYEYNAVYISDVTVEAGQVHLERLQKSGSGYERIADDTLMQNQTEMPNTDNILTARINEKQKRVYSLKTTSDNAKKTLNVSVPNRVLYTADTTLKPSSSGEGALRYYAYGAGHLAGVYENAGDAIRLAYDSMGWVTDSLGNRVWHRTARSNETVSMTISADAAVTSGSGRMGGCVKGILLREDAYADVDALLAEGRSAEAILEESLPGTPVNLTGCDMRQIYYYLSQNTPVLVISTNDTPLLLVGYDPYNVDIYDPLDGSTYKMGQQDALNTFTQAGNQFLGYLR